MFNKLKTWWNNWRADRDMMWAMSHCGGCGKHVDICDDACEAYAKLVSQALEDEAMGVYSPGYCHTTKQWFCMQCTKPLDSFEAFRLHKCET